MHPIRKQVLIGLELGSPEVGDQGGNASPIAPSTQ